MTLYIVGTGIYDPPDAHVAIARAWLSAHPRTRDAVAIEVQLRARIRGLRRQDVPELFEAATGCDLRDRETWPETWPAEWPETWPDPVFAPLPEPVAAPELEAAPAAAPAPPKPPRTRGPGRGPPVGVACDGARLIAPPRWCRADPIAGLAPEGTPVRALRLPVHLRPQGYADLGPMALEVAQVMRRAHAAGIPCSPRDIGAVIGESEDTIRRALLRLRAVGATMAGLKIPRNTNNLGEPGVRPDYARALTPKGHGIARAVPAVVDRHRAAHYAVTDLADMGVLDYLRERHLTGEVWVLYADIRASIPGADATDKALPRLHASGAIQRARLIVPGQAGVARLAPAVQVAWGCVAGGAS